MLCDMLGVMWDVRCYVGCWVLCEMLGVIRNFRCYVRR